MQTSPSVFGQQHPTITWTLLWNVFNFVWQDTQMLAAFGNDRQVKLLEMTARECFIRNINHKEYANIIRVANIWLDRGGFFAL